MPCDAAAMEIRINGEPRAVRSDIALTNLIADLGLPPAAVLIEHNGVALFRQDWPTIQLAAGDQLEIIRVVAGG